MVDIAEVLIRIKGDASSLTSASEKAKGNFSSMESGAKSAFSNIGSMATAGMGIAAAAIAAFAIKSFQDVDGAYKGIQKSVGATADQMNTTLKPAFDSVFGNFPVKADEAAAAVTKVYSGLKNLSDGLVPTAAQLTDVTSKFSELAAVGGTKVETLTTRLMPAFKALGVSANEIPAALNSIVIAAQGTGDKVDTLTASVAKAAPTFKQFGFGIEDTAAVMAKLDVSGVASSQVITGLNKVLKEAATSGEPPKKALADLEDQLKKGNLTGKEATALYKELGVKGFAAFRTAVQGGAFDVQALTGAMGANTTQLDASYEAQRTFSDKLTEFKNKLELAFAPLGKTLITLMENVLTAVEPVLPIITGLVSAFSKLPMPIQLVGIAFVGLLGGMGMLNVVLGKFGTSVTKLPGDIEKLIPTIKNLASSMSNVPSKVLGLGSKVGLGGAGAAGEAAAGGEAAMAGGAAAGGEAAMAGEVATAGALSGALLPIIAIVAAITAGFLILYATSGTFRDMIGGVLNTFKEIVGWVGQLASALTSGNFSKAGDLLKSGFTGAVDAIKNFDYGAWAAKMVLSIKESLGTIGSVILDSLSSLSDIADKITSWLNKINWDQVIKGLVDAITGLFGGGGGGAGAGATTSVSTGMNKSLVDGATKAAPNVLLKLVGALGGLAVALISLLPNIGIAIGKAILNGIIHLDWGGLASQMFKPSPIAVALLNAIKSVDWGGGVAGIGNAIRTAIVNFGSWLITAAASFFTDLPGKLTAALVGLGQWMWNNAADFVSVATWAAKLGAGALVGLGQWMWNNAVDFVSGAIWAVKLGVDALTGLGTWLWNAAVSFFTNTTWMSSMLSALSGLGEWMLTAAASFFTGLGTAVANAVLSLTHAVPSSKYQGQNRVVDTGKDTGAGATLYLSSTTWGECSVCDDLRRRYPDATPVRGVSPITHQLSSPDKPFPAAAGLIVGGTSMLSLQGGGLIGDMVGTNCATLPKYGPTATRSISGGCSCPPCYTFYAQGSKPNCCECGLCTNLGGVGSVAAMQGGGVFGAQAGGTHVLVAENGEAEAFIPEHLWGGIDPGLLASLQGYAKGGIVSPPHKLGKHPTQSQIERYNQQLGKYNQEQQLQQWDKSQLGGGGGNAYYDPSRTADQEIEYLTAVAENTGETKDQLQQQINLVNTYYPLYGKAASSTVDVKTAVEKLASDFATLPGGFKAGGATAATPGAWKDLKTGKWNYQTSDEQVAYLTQVAENTKETKAQLQKQVDQAEEYYKASGRATSKITDATTLIAAYNAKIAANTKLAAEEAQKALGDTIKNVATIVQDVVTGIISVGDTVFNLVSTVSSLNALPVRFGGTSTVDKYPATTSTLQDKGSLEIVTALSGSTPAIGSRSVVTHLQQANTTAINTGKSLFDGLGSLAGDVVKGVSSIGSEIGSMASTTKNSDSSLTGSLSTLTSSTNGTTGAVKDGTNSIVNAISSISGASGGGIGGVFSGIMSVISGFINLITDWINMQAEQAQPTSSQFMYGGSYYQTHSTKAPVSLDPFIKDLSTIVTGAVSIATGSIGLIGSFGVGGVAWTPQFAHIAEKEPELITPLSKLGSLGFGAGRQYNITIKVQGDENNATIDRIADKVVKKIRINEFLQAGR